MAPALIPVIISGGGGTRLWPWSRDSRPKQFLPLLSATSLFQQTLLRAKALDGAQAPLVVCNAAHRDLVHAQTREAGIEPRAIVLEPVGRNTAPAVVIAALLMVSTPPRGVDPLLLVLPADHVIADHDAFASAVRAATTAAAEGRLVTFGVVPDRAETGYGYILKGETRASWSDIGRFVEKPDLATAMTYVRSGEYLWNSGMFLFSATALLAEMRVRAPDILRACEQAIAEIDTKERVISLGSAFAACPATSLDYAVMEKTPRGAVVPLAAGWGDVGSWSALHDAVAHDANGNTVTGDVLAESCTNTYVAAHSRLVAAVGLDNVVIVETGDAVLVAHRDRAQDVKKIVEHLKATKRSET
jgi:mannose-1-phosphate guanylyltransferase/mannose-6-phosphate isomerase